MSDTSICLSPFTLAFFSPSPFSAFMPLIWVAITAISVTVILPSQFASPFKSFDAGLLVLSAFEDVSADFLELVAGALEDVAAGFFELVAGAFEDEAAGFLELVAGAFEDEAAGFLELDAAGLLELLSTGFSSISKVLL